jgi:hypothetical protein
VVLKGIKVTCGRLGKMASPASLDSNARSADIKLNGLSWKTLVNPNNLCAKRQDCAVRLGALLCVLN